MVAGHRYWVIIWIGILLLGLLGLGASIYWGRETGWKNLDELLRAIGTTLVSVGMLLLLYGVATGLGEALLVAALFCFIFAFIFGRRITPTPEPTPTDSPVDDQPRKRA
jgi:hypothetical protein